MPFDLSAACKQQRYEVKMIKPPPSGELGSFGSNTELNAAQIAAAENYEAFWAPWNEAYYLKKITDLRERWAVPGDPEVDDVCPIREAAAAAAAAHAAEQKCFEQFYPVAILAADMGYLRAIQFLEWLELYG
jgi:hypothetical protein